jgi:hypothetical protein
LTTLLHPTHNLCKPSRKFKQQWCACFPPANRLPPPTRPRHPTSPQRGCPIHRRQRRHLLLHRLQHQQRGARVLPTGAYSNLPGTSRATLGSIDMKSRLGTKAQPAPPGKRATSLAPPEPTLWAGISSTRGTPSATVHCFQPQPDDTKQQIMLQLM